MKRISVVLLLCLGIICRATAQQPAFVTDSLDAYIREGMQDWKIPGLAIAIVKNGEVVYMKGFGVRNLATRDTVDENTLFMIASNSKLFTGTALAHLEYHNKLSLNDKITKFFPTFRLYDPTTTSLVNIRDMLSHHLGTKTFQGDFTFWNSSLSRKEIMDKMRYLKPSDNFRQSYGYCNSCYLTAGEIIPVVTGQTWEVYVYDSIFVPLEMGRTSALGYNMGQMDNAARPYSTTFSDSITPIPYDVIDNLGPAGSIVSCVKDLTHWLQMQLDSGRYNGNQVLPWQVVKRTRQVETILNSTKSSVYPSHYTGYALGVMQRDYNGRQVYWHTGGADGFVTNTCFVPEEQLGITILTNNDNQNFYEALRYQLLDAYLGVPYTNRSKAQLEQFLQYDQATKDSILAWKARVKGNKPTLSYIQYTGTYSNDLYGFISIAPAGDDLKVKFLGHSNLTGTLQYMDNDEWLITYSNPVFGVFPVKFTKEGTSIVAVDIKVNDFIEYDAYHFTKQ